MIHEVKRRTSTPSTATSNVTIAYNETKSLPNIRNCIGNIYNVFITFVIEQEDPCESRGHARFIGNAGAKRTWVNRLCASHERTSLKLIFN
jgi:hypothetical protein